jgi:hypothetical protein
VEAAAADLRQQHERPLPRDVHGDEIAAILDVIKLCHLKGKGHVFQVLTKRADRMQRARMRHLRAAAEPLARRQRRGPGRGRRADPAAAADAGGRALDLGRAAARAGRPAYQPQHECTLWRRSHGGGYERTLHRLGRRRRRERARRAADASRLGAIAARSMRGRRACRSSSSSGAATSRASLNATTSRSNGRTAAESGTATQDIKYAKHWLSNEDGRIVIAWPTPKKIAGRKLDGRTHDE